MDLRFKTLIIQQMFCNLLDFSSEYAGNGFTKENTQSKKKTTILCVNGQYYSVGFKACCGLGFLTEKHMHSTKRSLKLIKQVENNCYRKF